MTSRGEVGGGTDDVTIASISTREPDEDAASVVELPVLVIVKTWFQVKECKQMPTRGMSYF